uniref:Uncharacterized protein n=1 Tax=Cacopsylla melanoneura TaxID=428564 RepID=A0A8D8Z4J9_9HEMI
MPVCSYEDIQREAGRCPFKTAALSFLNQIHDRHTIASSLHKRCLVASHCSYGLVRSVLNEKSLSYWTSLLCVKQDTGCPPPPSWAPWSSPTPCTAKCGRGELWRVRQCVSYQEGSSCAGEAYEQEACTGDLCSPVQEI